MTRARVRAFVAMCAFASCFASAQSPTTTKPGPVHASLPSPERAIHLTDYGGVCDGESDNSAALARALENARKLRLPVLVPEGRCAFADVIRVDGVTLTGSGARSELHALNWQRSAIFMSGTSPVLSNLRLTGRAAPTRQAAWEMTRITVFGATDFVIDRIEVVGAAAAGIQTAQAPTRGRITRNVVRDTLSDGIHLTGDASHILVEGNLVEGTGDDGIAVVSYWNDVGRVNHITARDNVVRNNRFGRNMSVVGGAQVVYENNLLQNNLAGLACLYIAQEAGRMPTKAASDVTAARNSLENCGGTDRHGAIVVFSDGRDINQNIQLLNNDILQPGQIGIRVDDPWNLNVRVEGNRVRGTSRPLEIGRHSVQLVPYAGGPVGYVPR